MTTTETTETQQIADDLAANIRTLEEISDRYPKSPCVNHLLEILRDNQDELGDDADPEEAAQMRADARWIRENLPDFDNAPSDQSYAEAYAEGVLETRYYAIRYEGGAGWEPHKIELLVSYGGPNVFISLRDGTGNHLEVTSYWGTEQGRAHVYAPHLAAHLQAQLDEMPL
jgi:HEPN domain-containing protein